MFHLCGRSGGRVGRRLLALILPRRAACLSALAVAIAMSAAGAGPNAGPGVEDLLQMPFQDVLAVRIRSAGKREEEIRDIPASVTIITRADIERYGWVTFDELLRNVPGFYLLDNTEDRFIGTRGAVGGGVQLLVNGIPQHPSLQKTLTGTETARLDIPVESIDRVEIIRGPMSVIYGNNAFQGVINIVTNEIDPNGPRVSASLGSRQSGQLFARAGTRFEDGFVVLNAGAYKSDGLAGAYADMLGPGQRAAQSPRCIRTWTATWISASLEAPDKRAEGRPIRILPISNVGDAAGAQILFVGKQAWPDLPRILARTRGKPILLVGDTTGMAERGVAIELFLKPDILGAGDQLRFRINPEAVDGRGLEVMADLYDVAEIVR